MVKRSSGRLGFSYEFDKTTGQGERLVEGSSGRLGFSYEFDKTTGQGERLVEGSSGRLRLGGFLMSLIKQQARVKGWWWRDRVED